MSNKFLMLQYLSDNTVDNIFPLIILSESIYVFLIVGFYYAYKHKFIGKYLLSIFTTFLIITLMKYAFKIPRPVGEGYGFPSRHAAIAFANAYFLPKPFLIWAILISISRVFLRCHTFLDITVGAIVGYTVSYCVNFFFQSSLSRLKRYRIVIYRKIVHILALFVILGVYWIFGQLSSIIYIAEIFSMFLIKKMKFSLLYEWYRSSINYFGKINEKVDEIPYGAIYMLISFTIISVLFSKDIFIISLLVLMFGDSLSAVGNIIFYQNYSMLPKFKKTLGYVFGAIFVFLIVSVFYNTSIGMLASFGYLIGEVLEKISGVDDNLTIPLSTAIVLSLV